jgi:hypothetical protein
MADHDEPKPPRLLPNARSVDEMAAAQAGKVDKGDAKDKANKMAKMVKADGGDLYYIYLYHNQWYPY